MLVLKARLKLLKLILRLVNRPSLEKIFNERLDIDLLGMSFV